MPFVIFIVIGVAWFAGFFDGRKGRKSSSGGHPRGWLKAEIDGIRADARKQLRRKKK